MASLPSKIRGCWLRCSSSLQSTGSKSLMFSAKCVWGPNRGPGVFRIEKNGVITMEMWSVFESYRPLYFSRLRQFQTILIFSLYRSCRIFTKMASIFRACSFKGGRHQLSVSAYTHLPYRDRSAGIPTFVCTNTHS